MDLFFTNRTLQNTICRDCDEEISNRNNMSNSSLTETSPQTQMSQLRHLVTEIEISE